MTAWHWNQLCGRADSNFTIWNKNDFGHCFEQLVFVCGTHFLLAITSAYHFSRHHDRRIRGNIPHSATLYLRVAVSLLLVFSPLLLLGLVYLYERFHPSWIDVISWCIRALSWLIHSGFVWRLRRLYHIHIRGPSSVVVSFMLTTAALVIQLRTVIIDVISGKEFFSTVEEYLSFLVGSLHLAYSISLIPWKRPEIPSSLISDYQVINESLDSERLLGSVSGLGDTVYGSILLPPAAASPAGTRIQLGVAQQGASCLSQLSFWWVQPMMNKGATEVLSSAEDLFKLPPRLKTENVDKTFKRVMFPDCPSRGGNLSGRNGSPMYDAYLATDNAPIPEVAVAGRGTAGPRSQGYGTCPAPHQGSSGPRDVYSEQVQTHSEASQGPMTLLKGLNRTFGLEYYCLGILKFLGDGLAFAGPLLLNLIVSYMENPREPPWHGYLYAAGLFLSTFLSSMLTTHFNYLVSVVGLKVRAALVTTIYRKSLAVSAVDMAKFSSGEIVNFMSTDTDRIVNFCPSFHAFWSLPVQTGVSLYLLYLQVGWAMLAGLGFTLLLIPVNRWLAIKIAQLSTDMMAQKDARVKVMNEILYGIRVIKFYAWERHFSCRIDRLRRAEVKSLKGRKYLDAACVYFWATTPVLISILTFMTYTLMGNTLTAAKVFTSMALFNMLITPLNAFPWVINGLMEAWVSIKRLQCFLLLPELDWDKYYSRGTGCPDKNTVIQVENASFSWQSPDGADGRDRHGGRHDTSAQCGQDDLPDTPGTLKLEGMKLIIEPGMYVGVIGTVGSGKSSLLSAILGEMKKEKGHIAVETLCEGFGLAAQEPWIQHATVRDNILFGKEYNHQRYEEVVDACALTEDLKILPHGDQTEIGENGVTLSGGQKARVALARAVYQDKSVYLLDDPLAAVDAHVAQHLFHKCLMGCLKGKTIIMCTHHAKFLQDADLVVVMAAGRIVRSGAPGDLLSSVDLQALLGKAAVAPDDGTPDDGTLDDEGEGRVPRPPCGGDVLVQEEERDRGVVKLHVYQSYWRAVGSCLSFVVLLALLLMQASRNVADWWLSYWVTHSNDTSLPDNVSLATGPLTLYPAMPDSAYKSLLAVHLTSPLPQGPPIADAQSAGDLHFYLMVYGILACCNSVFTFGRAFLYAYGGICAAVVLHRDLLASILRAPISFFDMTPIGRIVNRFSSDLYAVDDSLPFIMNIFLAQSFGVMGTLVITCYGLPWFILLLVPLSILYYFLQKYYRQTSREIKRICSVTLSPIYAHFSESISGLVTIRAMRETERFEEENRARLEVNQRAQFAANAATQWLAIRLQMFGVAMVTGVAFIAVLEHHFHTANAGLVGLAISYALAVTAQLSGVVSSFTETEKQMVSVERQCQYIENVPKEKPWFTLNAPPYWPLQGAVTFSHVHLQYRAGLAHALDGVTMETQPAEKVGIVGRTGSGKSSLFLALFRMVEVKSGYIMIDGLNVGHLPLEELRSRLAIIPQDPFLFSGSVRENLDPTLSFSDRELWAVLQKCHLVDAVERLGGLHADVAERGRHFSVGQRQLVCLARALLTRAKVLCIDEATASVDQETDSLIQETIREEFADNTVLTIAHRINTVLDSDRVLVMSNGQVAEFAPPGDLLRKPDSLFYGLVHGNS